MDISIRPTILVIVAGVVVGIIVGGVLQMSPDVLDQDTDTAPDPADQDTDGAFVVNTTADWRAGSSWTETSAFGSGVFTMEPGATEMGWTSQTLPVDRIDSITVYADIPDGIGYDRMIVSSSPERDFRWSTNRSFRISGKETFQVADGQNTYPVSLQGDYYRVSFRFTLESSDVTPPAIDAFVVEGPPSSQ